MRKRWCYLQWKEAPRVERQTYGRYPLHLGTKGHKVVLSSCAVSRNDRNLSDYSVSWPEARAWTWERKQSEVLSGAWLQGLECVSHWRPSALRSPGLSAYRWWPVKRSPHRSTPMLWRDGFKVFCGVTYLIHTRHDCKYGSVCNHCCFDASFWETGCHLVSLVVAEQIK